MPLSEFQITASTILPQIEDTSFGNRRGYLIIKAKDAGKRTAELDKLKNGVLSINKTILENGDHRYDGYCIWLDDLAENEAVPEYRLIIRKHKVIVTLKT